MRLCQEKQSPAWTHVKRSCSLKTPPGGRVHFVLWKTFLWEVLTSSDDVFHFLGREIKRQQHTRQVCAAGFEAENIISFTVCGSGDNRPKEYLMVGDFACVGCLGSFICLGIGVLGLVGWLVFWRSEKLCLCNLYCETEAE